MADHISQPYPTLEQLLEESRHRIEVTDEEITLARARRSAVADALRREFSGSRVYYNGSLAHGDALTPLEDVDLGVVVPNPEGRYGPGRRGPRELQDRAADAIRRDLKAEYGDLRVEVEGRKRSILVRFRDPLRPGWRDFTADVIVAIDNPTQPGLYIPRWQSWDRSAPETHTALVTAANRATDSRFARVVRLVKHWDRRQSEPPLCSWHIKALALGAVVSRTPLLDGLLAFFRHAGDELATRDTPDPAGVGPDIKTRTSRVEAARSMRDAGARLDKAIAYEKDGWHVLAHEELARLFNDPQMLPRPPKDTVMNQEAARLRARTAEDKRTPAIVGASAAAARPLTRSWRP